MHDSYFDQVLARYRQIKRHATAKNALDVTAIVLLGASLVFWATAFYQLFAPPALVSLTTLQVGVLAIVMAVVAPVLWSSLVPTTPAGQLLQRSQLRTVGFAFIVAAAIFLSKVAFDLIASWLYSQLSATQETADLVLPLAIALVIAFILVPALAWTQVAPERWLQQIEQAHQVKKLQALQSGELAIIKARLLWAKQKAAANYANLLPIEQQEIHDTLRGLFVSIGDTQRAIAATLRDSNDYDREFGIIQDQQVYDALDYVAHVIEQKRIDVPDVTVAPRRDAHVSTAAQSPIPRDEPDVTHVTARDDPRSSATIPDQEAYVTARHELGTGAWMVKDLAETLSIEESTARKLKATWQQSGLIVGAGMNGRFRFTEGTGVR